MENQYEMAANVIRDYLDKNDLESFEKVEMEEMFSNFQEKFSPEILQNLEGQDVLNKIFLHDGDKTTLIYNLEYTPLYKPAGAIGGGPSTNYNLFKSDDGWKYGNHAKSIKRISEGEAVEYAIKIRDALVNGAKYIKNSSLESIDDYENLEENLNQIFGEVQIKPTYVWVHKYYALIFPDKIPIIHNYKMKSDSLEIFGLDATYWNYGRDAQFYLLSKEAYIKLYSLFDDQILGLFDDNENHEGFHVSSSSKNVWVISPGEWANKWEECTENNAIYIGWDELGDLNNYNSREDIIKGLKKYYNSNSNQITNSKTIYDFSKVMDVGDIVFARKATKTILGVGIITSKYYFDEKRKDFQHAHNVKWIKKGEWPKPKNFKNFILTLLNVTNKDGGKYKYQLSEVLDFEIEKYLSSEYVEEYTKENFMDEVLFREQDYDELIELLLRKKNLILQGAPGVGKTFISKRLAYSLIGSKEEDQIEFIQFHQNYSYEDFIQGFRPDENGFHLENGIFYEFCVKAREHPEKDYFFIIDEINRGNISKIFGELLMLIEADKRGKEFEIYLTYNKDEKFHIPDNLYIIGMMNTADKSLAIIDYALRRRFVFYTVNTLFDDNYDELLKKRLDFPDEIKEDILNKFKKLNSTISNDGNLGEGFKIGHAYFLGANRDNYKSIIKYEIAPLLKEYWFDDLEWAKSEIEKLYL